MKKRKGRKRGKKNKVSIPALRDEIKLSSLRDSGRIKYRVGIRDRNRIIERMVNEKEI